MAKNSVSDWSTTAADNTDVGGVNIAEGCAPSGINNAIRAVMSQIKTWTATLLTTTAATFSASDQATMRANISASLKGHLYGLTLSNNVTDATNDIDIAAGEAASTETIPVLMALASAMTKRLDASWAVGTGNGGRDTGSIANTTYHVWLIRRSDTGVVDVLFSASASSPTMPANYDQKRRIGSILRESGAIVEFTQSGDLFLRNVQAEDVTATNPGTSAVTRTLSVPTGVVVEAIIQATILSGSSSVSTYNVLISALAQADASAGTANSTLTVRSHGAGNTYLSKGQLSVLTNTSGQIRSRASLSAAELTMYINTMGWRDSRGH